MQDRIPVSFTNKNGEFAGISRMIFDRVSELSGLRFEYIPLPEGDVTFEYLMEQNLDLVSSVEFNEENKHARGILLSDPYFHRARSLWRVTDSNSAMTRSCR